MRHEWHREIVIFYKLTASLRELEESGWEIFSISYDDGYYHVICRKEQEQ